MHVLDDADAKGYVKPLKTRGKLSRSVSATGRVEAAHTSARNTPPLSGYKASQDIDERWLSTHGSTSNASKSPHTGSRRGQAVSGAKDEGDRREDVGCFGKANTSTSGSIGGGVANGHSALLRRITFSSEEPVVGEGSLAEPQNNATPVMCAQRDGGKKDDASNGADDCDTNEDMAQANGDMCGYPTNRSQWRSRDGRNLWSGGHRQAAIRAGVGTSYDFAKLRRNGSHRSLGRREIEEESTFVVEGATELDRNSDDKDSSNGSTASSAKSRSVVKFSLVRVSIHLILATNVPWLRAVPTVRLMCAVHRYNTRHLCCPTSCVPKYFPERLKSVGPLIMFVYPLSPINARIR